MLRLRSIRGLRGFVEGFWAILNILAVVFMSFDSILAPAIGSIMAGTAIPSLFFLMRARKKVSRRTSREPDGSGKIMCGGCGNEADDQLSR